MTQLLEGTWEEIAAHADEFKGRRLQVKVFDALPVSTNGAAKEETVMEVLDRIGTVDGMPTDLSERAEEYFAEIMDEKYKKDMEKYERYSKERKAAL